jgi:hypothetical protein
MSDNKTTASHLDLLIASMAELAREIGEMEPDDPVRAVRLNELYTLTDSVNHSKPNEKRMQMNWTSKFRRNQTNAPDTRIVR